MGLKTAFGPFFMPAIYLSTNPNPRHKRQTQTPDTNARHKRQIQTPDTNARYKRQPQTPATNARHKTSARSRQTPWGRDTLTSRAQPEAARASTTAVVLPRRG